jgi:hypothetical protein
MLTINKYGIHGISWGLMGFLCHAMLGHQRVSEGKPTKLGHQSFAGLNHLFACVAAIRIIK